MKSISAEKVAASRCHLNGCGYGVSNEKWRGRAETFSVVARR